MNTYKVTYTTALAPYQLQRSIERAKDIDALLDGMALSGARVADVELNISAEYADALLAMWLEEYDPRTPEQKALDSEPVDDLRSLLL